MKSSAGFSAIELVVAIMLFSAATGSVLVVGKSLRDNRTAAASASRQNAYATFQSQVALQGINPALVGNPLGDAIQQTGTAGTVVALGENTSLTIARQRVAAFEVGAAATPTAAQRSLAGSARVDAISYHATAAGNQTARGAAIGFAIETSGAPPANAAMPLAPPVFNVTGDLTYATFPLNGIATLPATNPPGTTYHYTTDGTAPTAASPVWDNNPGWTAETFPILVTLAAFNTDPQYSPSLAVTAAYSLQLVVSYGRADGRTNNLYGFTFAELSDPADSGIALAGNVAGGYSLLYTLDGSDPTAFGTLYAGAFAPDPALFNPNTVLKIAAVANDPRYLGSGVSTYTLTSVTVPLGSPTFITSNAAPLSPGTPVVISVSGSASPRTEVNNGAPALSSSSATSFPLN